MKLAGEIRSSGVAVTLVVHEHKRLGRGIELAMLAEELKASDVGLEFLTGELKGSHDPSGIVFTVLAAMSGMEREYIRDRTLEGHESARKRGKTIGGAGATDNSAHTRRRGPRRQRTWPRRGEGGEDRLPVTGVDRRGGVVRLCGTRFSCLRAGEPPVPVGLRHALPDDCGGSSRRPTYDIDGAPPVTVGDVLVVPTDAPTAEALQGRAGPSGRPLGRRNV